jgi:hypothetical protein
MRPALAGLREERGARRRSMLALNVLREVTPGLVSDQAGQEAQDSGPQHELPASCLLLASDG